MTTKPLFQAEKSQGTKSNASVKLVTFSIGKLNLGLSIDMVYKVINLPPVHGSGLSAVGVTQVGDLNITVIDLHQRLFRTSVTATPSTTHYLILIQAETGEYLGIPVIAPPTLLEVSLSLIRPLPDSYRSADTLSIANYMAVIPLQQGSRTLFLLDTDFLLQSHHKS